MVIIPFNPNPEPWHAHRRRCAFAPNSLHVYRRALLRRIGVTSGGRPAYLLDSVARQLIQARV